VTIPSARPDTVLVVVHIDDVVSGSARIFAGGSYASSVRVEPASGDTTPSQRDARGIDHEHAEQVRVTREQRRVRRGRELRLPPRSDRRLQRQRAIGIARLLRREVPAPGVVRVGGAGGVEGAVRGDPKRRTAAGLVRQLREHDRPSRFGAHRPLVPSPGASPVAASTSAGPHVPSARQKPDAHSSSRVHVASFEPPHAASIAQSIVLQCNTEDPATSATWPARYDRGSELSILFLRCSKKPYLQCSIGTGRVRPWPRPS